MRSALRYSVYGFVLLIIVSLATALNAANTVPATNVGTDTAGFEVPVPACTHSHPSEGNPGAIWTTDAGGTHHKNQYAPGDDVYLSGDNFHPGLIWIQVQTPGNNGQTVGTAVYQTSTGSFLAVLIWHVPAHPGDNEYQVKATDSSGHCKNDNFHIRNHRHSSEEDDEVTTQ